MASRLKNNFNKQLKRIFIFLLSFCLLFPPSGFTQLTAELNISGYLGSMPRTLTPDKFRPLSLRYFSYDSSSDNFRFIFDKGGLKDLKKSEEINELCKTNLRFFLIGITLPDSSFWVNLRPDSEDQIIDAELAKTDVGRILLEADLQLKKDTAKFTSPQTPEGRAYWNKLYQKAGELFANENISIPTLTRPWIIPDEVIIRETEDSAYLYKATLKVMLEQDHLKNSKLYDFKDERLKVLNEYSSELIRELILPKLTQEVNLSQRYAPLRQVYYSLILSRWFKGRFRGQNGLYSQAIDSQRLTGLTSKDTWSKTTYFEEYRKSFQDGEYNLEETVPTSYGQVIRSYLSGGVDLTNTVLPLRGFAGENIGILTAIENQPNMVPLEGAGENLLENLTPSANLSSSQNKITSSEEESIASSSAISDDEGSDFYKKSRIMYEDWGGNYRFFRIYCGYLLGFSNPQC